MKTSKAIVLVMAALALSATPALAQRGGGGRSGGGGSHSSSVSSSRSSSSSSSSRSSSSFSSSSRSSSSSSRSSSSISSPSRSSSSSSRSSISTRSGESSRSAVTPRSSESRGSSVSPRSGVGTTRSGESSRSGVGTTSRGEVRHSGVRGREAGHTAATRGDSPRSDKGTPFRAPAGATSAAGRPSSGHTVSHMQEGPAGGYARPGHPGGYMPPAARPIHPAPYFHHPWYGHMVHCHLLFWDPIPPRPWYWPGFWAYCNTYWYDYHVTDVVVVREHVQDAYHVDMITYGISGDIMYAIVRDGGSTYLQVYDKDDHLLAEQKINKKYCNMVIDSENGGCWISKKKNKDPLLFIWADGQLLIYEAD